MKILIVGASKGLGKALVEGLLNDGHSIFGVARNKPIDCFSDTSGRVHWIEADLSEPMIAVDTIQKNIPKELDAIIYNLGIWEEFGFTDDYNFLESTDAEIDNLITVNITATMLLLKRLIPALLKSSKPQIILTGSTSGLPQSGGMEVAFGASKFALRGIADALREGFREQKLAVTCLQLGDLNTGSADCSDGSLIPLDDVVNITRAILNLSRDSFVKEIILPAILDKRF